MGIWEAAMKRKVTFGKIIWFLIIAYLCIGLVYSLAGYAQDMLAGKTIVYPLLVSIPFDMIGWLLSIWGDYINGFLDLQFFVTLAAILIAFILFLRMLFRKPKSL